MAEETAKEKAARAKELVQKQPEPTREDLTYAVQALAEIVEDSVACP